MSASDRLQREKRALRARLRALRDGLPDADRQARSIAIARTLLALPELATARTVMVFSSFGSEVDTGPIVERLLAEGRRVTLPRIEEGDIVPVAWRAGDPMRVAPFGMREPAGDVMVAPDELDVVVTPGLAFDRRGYRIGYGGGFYDRLFAKTRDDASAPTEAA